MLGFSFQESSSNGLGNPGPDGVAFVQKNTDGSGLMLDSGDCEEDEEEDEEVSTS